MDAEALPGSLLTLRRLPTGYRLLYTGALAFFILGHAAGLLQQHLRAGLGPRGAAEWILGNEDAPEATRFLFPRDASEVLDDVGRRSLADVIPTLVVLALLFRSGASGTVRAGLSGALFGAAVLDMAGPALVKLLGPWAGWLWWLGAWTLAVSVTAAALLCVFEMWALRGAGRRFRPAVGARP